MNYYTWIPGSAGTFNDWAEFGGDEWTWANVKEYLCKVRSILVFLGGEVPSQLTTAQPATTTTMLVSSARNCPTSGRMVPFRVPLGLATGNCRVPRGAREGVGEQSEASLPTMSTAVPCAAFWKAMNTIYNGKRSSSWRFIEGKQNVTVMGRTNAKRIIIEGGKAVGAEVIGPDGETYEFRANKEVILSLGVYESPKPLMLSGIGPQETLDKFNIKTEVESPACRAELARPPDRASRLQDQRRPWPRSSSPPCRPREGRRSRCFTAGRTRDP